MWGEKNFNIEFYKIPKSENNYSRHNFAVEKKNIKMDKWLNKHQHNKEL
jgi:hypothetical protein